MNDLISIVIPMYNCGKFISECIDSIINQTIKNFELILIDDGSSDDTIKKCQSYLTDSRVKLISKNNSGVSDTRNMGINHAKGKYIVFVDSDDILESTMLENMLRNMIKFESDLVICNFNYLYKNKQKSPKIFDDSESCYKGYNQICRKLLSCTENEYFYPIWNKMYKKQIINDFSIKFDKKLYCGEDFKFNIDYLSHCKKISTVPEMLYNYRIIENSLSKRFDFNKWDSEKKIIGYYINFNKKNNFFDTSIHNIYFLKFKECLDLLVKSKETQKNQNDFLKKILNDSDFVIAINHLTVNGIYNKYLLLLAKLKLSNILILNYKLKNWIYNHFLNLFIAMKGK